jgi:hypothetical protein
MQDDTTKEVVTESWISPTTQSLNTFAQRSPASPRFETPITDSSTIPADQQNTPISQLAMITTSNIITGTPIVNVQKCTATSTPSNIGHLMAGLSTKSSKVQELPYTGSPESMPTPLRRMSERLGLKSPNVVRRGRGNNDFCSDLTTISDSDNTGSPICALESREEAAVKGGKLTTTTNPVLKQGPLVQLFNSATVATSPIVLSRPNISTTEFFTGLSTPPRPDLPRRAQSFGTPARLRSSIEQDMYKVQESLKRSIGPNFTFQSNGTKSAMRKTFSATVTNESESTVGDDKNDTNKVTRSTSIVGHAKSSGVSSKCVVPKRQINTAVSKPRPKSVIVGSAKVLETISAQISSPRERAKLRSATTTPSISRPSTAASTSRRSATATTVLPAKTPCRTIRTPVAPALRSVAPPKRATPPTSITEVRSREQTSVSAEAIAERVAGWSDEDRKKAALKKPTRTAKMRSNPTSKTVFNPIPKTPEPRRNKKEINLEQSYTPPGIPTRLPSPVKSKSKTRLAVPTTPASKKTFPPMRTPAAYPTGTKTPLPLMTPANRRIDPRDPNALRTPSKEIESSLDRAIDAKIAEDARNGKEFTPSGNRISELLEAKRGR